MKVQGTTGTGVTTTTPLTEEERKIAAEAAEAQAKADAEKAGRAADADVIRTLRNAESSFEALSAAVSIARESNAYLFVVNETTGKPFTSHTAYITHRASAFPLVGKAMGKALVLDMHAHGDSIRAAAAAAGVSVGTAAGIVKAAKAAKAAEAEAAAIAEAERVAAEAKANGDTEAATEAKAEAAKLAEAKAAKLAEAEAKADAKAIERVVSVLTGGLTEAENIAHKLSADQLASVILAASNALDTFKAVAATKVAPSQSHEAVTPEERKTEAKARRAATDTPPASLAEAVGLAKPRPSVRPSDVAKAKASA